jgi:hypothetical protein
MQQVQQEIQITACSTCSPQMDVPAIIQALAVYRMTIDFGYKLSVCMRLGGLHMHRCLTCIALLLLVLLLLLCCCRRCF